MIRWCDWDGDLRLVSTGLRLSGWMSVTTVERNICVTYLTSSNFISDYHTLCVNNSV